MGECRIYNLPNKAYDGGLRVPVEKAGETTGSIELSALGPYIVERKHGTNTDGSSWWYTLWSDKWCEQGGRTNTKYTGQTDTG